jgi:hypothetical protein
MAATEEVNAVLGCCFEAARNAPNKIFGRQSMQQRTPQKHEAAVISHEHPGLVEGSVQPLEASVLNPEGSTGHSAGVIVECRSYANHPRSTNPASMRPNPSFLLEQPKSHPDDVATRIIDPIDHGLILFGCEWSERRGPGPYCLHARAASLQFAGENLRYAGPAAVKEVTP